jgi:uncharacterized protein YndB with AHSA1/START domain
LRLLIHALTKIDIIFTYQKINHMPDNTVTLHRVVKTTPQKLYRAFTEAHALASWLPPYGFVAVVHEMDARVGGSYKMSFINFSTGNGHSFGGKFIDLRANEFLQYTDKFDDPNLPGEMITTIWLKKVSAGTELKVVQENIPAVIPVEMCYLGWQESLEKLIKLVEPEIPDA